MQIHNTQTRSSTLADDQCRAVPTRLLSHVTSLGEDSQHAPMIQMPENIGLPREIQTILRKAFAAQREEILTQPSSSNNTRLAALDSLEKRDFQPAEGGLRIRLTGKGLGGAGNSPEWDELLLDDDDEDSEIRIRADIRSWQEEVEKQEANISSTANAVYEANQAVANELHTSQGVRASTLDKRDELEKNLSFYQSELRLAKEQVRYYQGLLRSLG